MPPRYSRRTRPVRRSRRVAWATFNQGALVFTTGQSRVFALVGDTAYPIGHAGMTVLRTEFLCQFNYGNQNDTWQLGTIVTRLADIGGSNPNVLQQPDDFWLWYDTLYPTASGATFDQALDYRASSRTKRRIHGQSDTYAISVTNNSAATHNCSLNIRTLIALP